MNRLRDRQAQGLRGAPRQRVQLGRMVTKDASHTNTVNTPHADGSVASVTLSYAVVGAAPAVLLMPAMSTVPAAPACVSLRCMQLAVDGVPHHVTVATCMRSAHLFWCVPSARARHRCSKTTNHEECARASSCLSTDVSHLTVLVLNLKESMVG
eukprot:354100-Chlamydomonas_euryale.AAC.2